MSRRVFSALFATVILAGCGQNDDVEVSKTTDLQTENTQMDGGTSTDSLSDGADTLEGSSSTDLTDTMPRDEIISPALVVSEDWRGDAPIMEQGDSRVEVSDTSSDAYEIRDYRFDDLSAGADVSFDFDIYKSDTPGNVALVRVRHIDDSTDIKRNFLFDPASGEYSASGGLVANVDDMGERWTVNLSSPLPEKALQTRLILFPAAGSDLSSGLNTNATGKIDISDIKVSLRENTVRAGGN